MPEQQKPTEIRFVSSEPIPQQLFVCSAGIKPETGRSLKSLFESGLDLPEDLEAVYKEHLAYTYGLGDKYYQAGPSADFTDILYIFSTINLEEAQTIMHNDPFFKAGIYFGDSWFSWEVHSPYWKIPPYLIESDQNIQAGAGLKPVYSPGTGPNIKEIKVDVVTPFKLFVCFSKMNREILEPYLSPESKTSSIILIQHVYNCASQGGAGPMGYHWLSGPSVDYTQDLSIFSVNSLFMAQLIKENDAFSRYGLFSNIRYFEWCIHTPVRKASPQHKETLIRFLNKAGVKLARK